MTIAIEGGAPLIQVFDMPRTIAFWRFLGFEVAMSSGEAGDDDVDWVLLRHGGCELMLNTMYERGARPAAPDPARVAAHADTCLFLGCRDLDAAYTELRARGVAAEPPVVRPYGMRQLSFSDPDGYGVCLQWRAGGAGPG